MRANNGGGSVSRTSLFLNTLLSLLHLQRPTMLEPGEAAAPPTPPTCPAFSPLPFWIRQQCPPMVDFRCVVGLPGDLPSPIGQLNCATADDLPSARLKMLTAQEMLQLVKYRDPTGRPWCLLTLFYSPDCVFSAKVSNSFYQIARHYPKLRVIAVDVSQRGKDTESLISQYGIASTPVIALWQDGFPRYRLYDDYSRPNTLVKVIRAQTDLRPRNWVEKKKGEQEEGKGEEEGAERRGAEDEEAENGVDGGNEREPSRREFLGQFKYLQEELGFDWYLLAAWLTCIANLLYFGLTSTKGRQLLERRFPGLFGVIIA